MIQNYGILFFFPSGILRPLKHGLVLLFALCFAVLTYFYKHEKGALGSNIGVLLKLVLGQEEDPDILERYMLSLYEHVRRYITIRRLTTPTASNTNQSIDAKEKSIIRTLRVNTHTQKERIRFQLLISFILIGGDRSRILQAS
jgi:hypothetical protein